MSDTNSKIKFYSLGSEKINLSKISNKDELDSKKTIIASEGFNNALKSVIEKDVNLLSDKVDKIAKEINKMLIINNFSDEKISDNIDDIDNIVNDVETIISKFIIEKESINVGIFTTNKKEKRKRYNDLDACVNSLLKYQTELVSVKNEYNKLLERKNVVVDVCFEENKKEVSNENPLERTVNFYINKQKEN